MSDTVPSRAKTHRRLVMVFLAFSLLASGLLVVVALVRNVGNFPRASNNISSFNDPSRGFLDLTSDDPPIVKDWLDEGYSVIVTRPSDTSTTDLEGFGIRKKPSDPTVGFTFYYAVLDGKSRGCCSKQVASALHIALSQYSKDPDTSRRLERDPHRTVAHWQVQSADRFPTLTKTETGFQIVVTSVIASGPSVIRVNLADGRWTQDIPLMAGTSPKFRSLQTSGAATLLKPATASVVKSVSEEDQSSGGNIVEATAYQKWIPSDEAKSSAKQVIEAVPRYRDLIRATQELARIQAMLADQRGSLANALTGQLSLKSKCNALKRDERDAASPLVDRCRYRPRQDTDRLKKKEYMLTRGVLEYHVSNQSLREQDNASLQSNRNEINQAEWMREAERELRSLVTEMMPDLKAASKDGFTGNEEHEENSRRAKTLYDAVRSEFAPDEIDGQQTEIRLLDSLLADLKTKKRRMAGLKNVQERKIVDLQLAAMEKIRDQHNTELIQLKALHSAVVRSKNLATETLDDLGSNVHELERHLEICLRYFITAPIPFTISHINPPQERVNKPSEPYEPTLTKPENETHIYGVTHRVDDGVYYLDNKAVVIPDSENRNYIDQIIESPNEVVINGTFRFVENRDMPSGGFIAIYKTVDQNHPYYVAWRNFEAEKLSFSRHLIEWNRLNRQFLDDSLAARKLKDLVSLNPREGLRAKEAWICDAFQMSAKLLEIEEPSWEAIESIPAENLTADKAEPDGEPESVALDPLLKTATDWKRDESGQLSSVAFHGVVVTDDAIEVLSQQHGVTGLQLANATITDEQIGQLNHLNRVERLALWGSNVKPSGVALACQQFPKLKYLSLASTKGVSDESAISISNLGSLRRLAVGWCGATDRHLAVFATMPNLQTLNIESSRLSFGGLMKLRDCKSLRKLVVTGIRPGLNDRQKQALKEALPEVAIEF